VDDRRRGAAVRGKQVEDRFEVVDRVQIELHGLFRLLTFITRVLASYAAPVPDQPQPASLPPAAGAKLEASTAVPPYGRLNRLPPQSFFLLSAFFHYLGPSLAVLTWRTGSPRSPPSGKCPPRSWPWPGC
jgi:hypothetical protein